MEQKQFLQLIEKIDFLSKVLIMNLIKDLEFKEKVIQLSVLGFKEIDVVKMLNSTRDKVHSILRNMK